MNFEFVEIFMKKNYIFVFVSWEYKKYNILY